MVEHDPTKEAFALQNRQLRLEKTVKALEAQLTESRHRENELLQKLATAKTAERNARKAQHTLTALMEHIPVGITIAETGDGGTHLISRYGRQLTGTSSQRAGDTSGIGCNSDWQIFAPDGRTPLHPDLLPLNRALQAGQIVRNEELVIRQARYGRTIHLLCNAAPIRDAAERITGAIVVWRDIGNRKAVEKQLRLIQKRLKKQETTLRLATESTGIGTIDYYPATGQFECSALAKKHFGMVPEAPVDFSIFLAGLHPNDRNRVNHDMQQLLKSGSPRRILATEYRTVGIEDQKLRWIAVRGKVFFDRNEQPARFIGTTLDVTDRKLSEAVTTRLASIVEFSDAAIISLSLNGVILTWNRGAEKLYGYPADAAIGKPYTFLIAARQTDPFPAHSEEIALGACVASYETIMRTKDGRFINVLVALSPIRDERNTILGVSSVTYDITAQKKAENALKAANEKLQSTLASITDGYLKLGLRWEFLEMNPVAEKIFGPAASVVGKICWQRYPQTVGSEFYMQVHNAAKTGHPVHFESQSILSGKWYETHAYPRNDGVEIYFRDISDRKRFEQEITHLAYHDLLTGLPNKKLLIDLFRMELAHARRDRRKIAVLFVDLDDFKRINDDFGHAAGDLLLKEVSERLKHGMRGADIVSRVGGDEFNIILPNITDSADAATISRKLIEDLNKPIIIYGKELIMTSSIGISIFPDDSEDIDTLCRYADIAMYRAKQQGRNNYQFHDASLNTKSLVRIRMESSLNRALINNEFVLFYQPQLISGQPACCAEVLLRWQHPEDGLLTPDRFLGMARETGTIIAIGEWVLRTACKQSLSWKAAGYPQVCLSINLSDREFQDSGLPEKTRRILHQTGIAPHLLEYEITEGIAMRDFDYTLSTTRQLKKMGVRLSLDDFGTGLSCLDTLVRLPLHKLKIDRSFIRKIGDDPPSSAIVHTATTLARELNILAVAEGVETEAQMKALRKIDCTNMQGHFFSRPLPADQFEAQVLRTRCLRESPHVVA